MSDYMCKFQCVHAYVSFCLFLPISPSLFLSFPLFFLSYFLFLFSPFWFFFFLLKSMCLLDPFPFLSSLSSSKWSLPVEIIFTFLLPLSVLVIRPLFFQRQLCSLHQLGHNPLFWLCALSSFCYYTPRCDSCSSADAPTSLMYAVRERERERESVTHGQLATTLIYARTYIWGCPCGVIVKSLGCGIVVSEFELQSRYYVHFLTNTLEKGMNPLILPVMG